MSNSSELISILRRERRCEADWLILQARDLVILAESEKNPTLLVFAALEARNAIEQLWFQLLLVIHEGSISKELFEKCRRRRDGYLAAINDSEPRYRLLSRFSAIALNLESKFPHKIIPWDLARLKKYWQQLSDYCHAQGHPESTIDSQAWINNGHELVLEVFRYFASEMARGATGIMTPKNMIPAAQMIWEDFAEGRIDEEAVKTRLQLVRP